MSHILHQPDQQQFICEVEGKIARLRYHHLDASRIDAYSTFVPPELRSLGIADQLARALWHWTQAQGLTIVPSCSYIEVWLRRHTQN